jgi:hypothetical protein
MNIKSRPAVIYETVRVAKKFLKEHPDFSPRAEKEVLGGTPGSSREKIPSGEGIR